MQSAVVTIDAIGCQKAIARDVVVAGAAYVLALKGNHPSLDENVRLWLATEIAQDRLPQQETVDKDHGRIEIRHYALSDQMAWLEQQPEWAGLQALGRVESTRIIGEKITTEYRYYLCSLTDPACFAEPVRRHWDIESGQHGVLDLQFGADANRALQHHAAENLALIRRMALKVIRHNGPSKDSLRRRKLCASLNDG